MSDFEMYPLVARSVHNNNNRKVFITPSVPPQNVIPSDPLLLLLTSDHLSTTPHQRSLIMAIHSPSFIVLLLLLLSVLLHTPANASYEIPLNETDDNGCGIGEEYRAGSCNLCRPGTYRFLASDGIPTRDPFRCPHPQDYNEAKIEPSNDRCEPCPAGTYNPFPGAQTFRRCRSCPVGTTSAAGASNCTPCKPWQSSAYGSPMCVRCGRGYMMTAPCARGMKPSQACTKCPRGSYATSVNTAECTECPEGMGTRKRGATSKKMCKPCGSHGVKCSCRRSGEPWGGVSSFRPIGQSVCQPCPAGTRALSPFATKASDCKPCPNGTEYIYLEGCKPCAKGMKSFGIGASNCRKKWTDKCPFDSFKDARGVCKLCRAGYFWNTKKLECQRCAPGTTAQGYSETSCRVCRFPSVAPPNDGFCSCGPGYFKDYENSYDCVKCPRGTKKEKMFHEDSRCDLDCEKFPNQPGCKKCGVDYERIDEGKGCAKCKDGLISLEGEERCVDPQSGCGANSRLGISPSKWGYSVSCFSKTSQ